MKSESVYLIPSSHLIILIPTIMHSSLLHNSYLDPEFQDTSIIQFLFSISILHANAILLHDFRFLWLIFNFIVGEKKLILISFVFRSVPPLDIIVRF